VRRWKPDYVFVENVPGLQRVDGLAGPLPEFMTLLKKLGYSFDLKVVPALSFGVPQKRERLILMAAKIGELRIPAPTHGTPRRPASTVRDWIGGLPPLLAGASDPKDPDHRAMALGAINLKRISATPRRRRARRLAKVAAVGLPSKIQRAHRRVRSARVGQARRRPHNAVHLVLERTVRAPHAGPSDQRPRSRMPSNFSSPI
jgi:site-specific DNA-cytosine methylase